MINNIERAVNYYQSMLDKNFIEAESCLHPEVNLISPFSNLQGKNDVFEEAKKFATALTSLEIREKFSLDNKVVLIMNLGFLESESSLRAVSFLTFQDGLIYNIELFFDTSAFGPK